MKLLRRFTYSLHPAWGFDQVTGLHPDSPTHRGRGHTPAEKMSNELMAKTNTQNFSLVGDGAAYKIGEISNPRQVIVDAELTAGDQVGIAG